MVDVPVAIGSSKRSLVRALLHSHGSGAAVADSTFIQLAAADAYSACRSRRLFSWPQQTLIQLAEADDMAAGGLALQDGQLQQQTMGPCLTAGMGEAAVFERLNSWGAAHDLERLDQRANLADLRSSLAATQAAVETTFEAAKTTLTGIVINFRAEAESLRQHGLYEAAQSTGRLEVVVAEARLRFDAQDASYAAALAEQTRRLHAVEAWAGAEPARVMALVHATPAPPWVPRSPGGTPISFYPVQAAPFTPPQRSAVPAWDASPAAPTAASATPA
jgi:hypothetical protein